MKVYRVRRISTGKYLKPTGRGYDGHGKIHTKRAFAINAMRCRAPRFYHHKADREGTTKRWEARQAFFEDHEIVECELVEVGAFAGTEFISKKK